MFSEIFCLVKGKVQGVGYRYTVERYAVEHGLRGWVRNNEDGSVEAVIQGTPDELKATIEMLNVGSPLSKVESIAVDWRTPESRYEDFQVL